MVEDIKAVLNAPIPYGERVLWVKMFLEVEYKPFSGAQTDVAAVFNINRHTFKKTITDLSKRGAVVIRSKVRGDKMGEKSHSAKYQLVPIEMWNAGVAQR